MRDFDPIPPNEGELDDKDAVGDGNDGVEPEPIGLGDMLFGEENEEFDNGINDSNNEDGQAGATSPVEKLKGHPRRFWRVDTPLRVEPPPSFNAPLRPVEQTREQQIKGECNLGGEQLAAKTGAEFKRALGEPSRLPNSDHRPSTRGASCIPRGLLSEMQSMEMSDYHLLAFSSKRSGRHEMEGLAHYSAGVTMDSMGQYWKALENYKKFYDVYKALENPCIEGVCHNCMGVDYMLMACPPGSNMQEKTGGLAARASSAIKRALVHHEAHLKIADEAGSGVAHSNIGLCHGLLGDYLTAAKHHQEALRVGLSIQSLGTQSVAVGNLGTLAMRQSDVPTAAACLDQHLQLVQQLGDWQGEINAWSKMGQLAASEAGERHLGRESSGGDDAVGLGSGFTAGAGALRAIGQDAVARSLWCFERAAGLAKAHTEVSTLKRLHCDMGVVRGNSSMDDYFGSLHAAALSGTAR